MVVHDSTQYNCIDNRDNTTFSYNGNTLYNLIVGEDWYSFNLIDDMGVDRHLTSSDNGYIACTEVIYEEEPDESI